MYVFNKQMRELLRKAEKKTHLIGKKIVIVDFFMSIHNIHCPCSNTAKQSCKSNFIYFPLLITFFIP